MVFSKHVAAREREYPLRPLVDRLAFSLSHDGVKEEEPLLIAELHTHTHTREMIFIFSGKKSLQNV